MITRHFSIRICILFMVNACHPPPPGESSLSNWDIATENFGISSTYPIHKNHRVGSAYGIRLHPVTGKSTMHHGHDIPCKKGTPIRTVASGEVTRSEHSVTGGNLIEVTHYGKILFTHVICICIVAMCVRVKP